MRRQDFYIQSIGGYSLLFGRWLLVKFGSLLRAPMDFKCFNRWLLGIRVTMARCIRSHYSAPSVPFSEQCSPCHLFIYVASNIILLIYLLISPLSLFLTVRNSRDALVKPIKWNASERYWIAVRDYVVGKSSFWSHCYLIDVFSSYHFLFFILKNFECESDSTTVRRPLSWCEPTFCIWSHNKSGCFSLFLGAWHFNLFADFLTNFPCILTF